MVVAVEDTQVYDHPDLRGSLLPGTDLLETEQGHKQQEPSSHGTLMAGLIAAHGQGANMGALGIAPKARILPVRVQPDVEQGTTDALAAGVEWATAKNVDVISVSSVAGASARLQRAVRAALDADIVVVAAAGNRPEDMSVGYPASFEGVIAVGGIDQTGGHALVSVAGPGVDVVAPAVDIYSTSYGGKYSKGTGTSSATAIVAGAAALIRSKYPDLPAEEVAHRLTATAIDKGPPGRDDEYGYGVIDLVAALTADVPPLGFESATATPPASAQALPGDESAGATTTRGLVTLGVLLAAGGGYLVWRRCRRAEDPPPRISR
ncbi:S8 family serine peptidase [Micromonospora soli]|uniref:S8 family serine peptidase n=1 Tax=Micromonospora sp. NBRC 110009 TaxID=3061627 RepID=UPI002670D50C|nr:S8 family serine peptidase [Micromonospora sp. NBRC 110009]WKU00220.1 S8 family serine peptidase [Micromonospora sp. NBRC 110009]